MALEKRATGFPQLMPESALYSNSSTKKFPLGMLAMDVDGNFYRYVKASEAIAFGELVTGVALAAWDSGILVDGAVTAADTKIHIDTVTTAMDEDEYADFYIRQAEAAGLGILHKIVKHPAIAASGEGDIYLEDGGAQEAFANNAALSIYSPYYVEKTDAGTELIRGVGITALTADYFGFVQVGGVTSVLCDGDNGAAVVLNEPIVPYGTDAGQGQGMAGGDEADIMEAAASPLRALDASTTDAGYVPAVFTSIV